LAILIVVMAMRVPAQEAAQKTPEQAPATKQAAEDTLPNTPSSKFVPSKPGNQINVNWFYGSYVPKDVPLEPLNARYRFKLYVRQTYTTWGIYLKTALFATGDQIHNTNPEWGEGFEGFAKRLGTRQAEFVIQNTVIFLGDGALGWEPRYDRCRCNGIWPRTWHAIDRNFVTYDRTERSLRPQLFTYLGAFTGAATASSWGTGKPKWQVEGYQAAITQIPIGIGINLIGEFAPDFVKLIHTRKK
jgi:hypothetical protein